MQSVTSCLRAFQHTGLNSFTEELKLVPEAQQNTAQSDVCCVERTDPELRDEDEQEETEQEGYSS